MDEAERPSAPNEATKPMSPTSETGNGDMLVDTQNDKYLFLADSYDRIVDGAKASLK